MLRSQKLQVWPLLLLACVLLIAGSASAGDATAPDRVGTRSASETPAKAMTAEDEAELRAFLAPRLNRSSEDLVEVTEADGGITMDPQGGFQTVSLVRVAADGTVEIGCFDELEAAISFLKFETASPGPDHEPVAE